MLLLKGFLCIIFIVVLYGILDYLHFDTQTRLWNEVVASHDEFCACTQGLHNGRCGKRPCERDRDGFCITFTEQETEQKRMKREAIETFVAIHCKEHVYPESFTELPKVIFCIHENESRVEFIQDGVLVEHTCDIRSLSQVSIFFAAVGSVALFLILSWLAIKYQI